MSTRLPFPAICFVPLLATVLSFNAASAQVRVYIVTDLEGASGVYKFAQTRELGNPLNEKAKEYLMGDIAAVVRGLREGGATEILVLDGHGTQAFVPHLMEPGAKYVTGTPRPGTLWGLDESYAALVQLGAHAMMGTARRRPVSHSIFAVGEPVLVQRRRVRRIGPMCRHRRALRRADDHGDWRRSDLPRSRALLRASLRDGGRQTRHRPRGGRALSVRREPTSVVRGGQTGARRPCRNASLIA